MGHTLITSLAFRVDGVPCPQGSLRAFAYQRTTGTLATRVVSDNPDLAAWRQAVAWSALAALPAGRTTFGGPVDVVASFVLARPRRRARPWPTSRPDVDKLLRAVLDALTGIVWRDDAQVVRTSASKHYAAADELPHASIIVTAVARGPAQRGFGDVD